MGAVVCVMGVVCYGVWVALAENPHWRWVGVWGLWWVWWV